MKSILSHDRKWLPGMRGGHGPHGPQGLPRTAQIGECGLTERIMLKPRIGAPLLGEGRSSCLWRGGCTIVPRRKPRLFSSFKEPFVKILTLLFLGLLGAALDGP